MFKFALLLGVVALANACSHAPGTITTTVTTTVTTVSADDESSGALSSHERCLIRKTWENVKKNGEVAPKFLFRFIKAHPEYQSKFSKFANVPQAELMGNGNFLAQAYTILAGLNIVIQSLSSQEFLDSKLNSLGSAHQHLGITPIMLEKFGVIVAEVLENEISCSVNGEAKSAWKNAIRTIVAGVSKNLKKTEDLTDHQTKLTPRQIADVQKSWENIRDDRVSMVFSTFVKLFKENPRAQKHFYKFAGVPIESLIVDVEYNKQVTLVADRLDSIIAAMDDKFQFLGNINYMKYSHIQRGIPREIFEDFGRLLLNVLSANDVSCENLESWRSVLTVFINAIFIKN